jgi:ferredoxin
MLTSSYPWLWTDPSTTASQIQGDAKKLPAVMVIVGVHQYSATTTLYQLEAAEGYTWPENYPAEGFTGKYWIESTKVTILEPCDKCGKFDCESSHENWCEICKVDDCTNDHIFATVTDSEGKEQTITAPRDTSLLRSLEAAGIAAPAHCRSGECGWCHSKLVSGEVYTPKSVDGRREADYLYGYIHPCCSFPLSDLVIEVPPVAK